MPFLCSSRNTGLIHIFVCLLLYVGAFAPLGLRAQDLRYLHHQSWSTETGLPQNSVHQIIQSNDGFIWIATEGGIARFDGLTFQAFDHSNEPAFLSDDACCLANGANGDLWIGTADGLLRMHRGQFTSFSEKDGLPSSSIQALSLASSGTLTVVTANGSAELKGDRFAPSSTTRHTSQSLANNIALSGGVSQGANGVTWAFSNSSVSASAYAFSQTWKAGSELPQSRIESLFVDRQGKAWVGTNDGLLTLTKDAKRATNVPELRGSTVLNTFEDREGNYWVGTETSGLHLLRTVKFRSEPELEDKAIAAVVQAGSENIWVGTKMDGLRRVRDGKLENPVLPERLTSQVILSLAPGTNGSVWVGTPDGLNHVSADGAVRQITSADGLPDDYIQALLTASDGSVWVGTRHGLVHLRGASMETITTANGLSSDLVGVLLLTREHELWIATSGGLSRRMTDGKITSFTERDGLPTGIVTAMVEGPGTTLWVATNLGGISRFSNGKFHSVKSSAFHTPIDGMVLTGPGYLWLRTGQGIERVLVKELEACAESGQSCSPHVSRYGLADGLPSEEVVPGGSPTLWRMANGELWVATRRGAGIVDPDRVAVNPVPPPVVIERFLVDDATFPTDEGDVSIGPGHVRYTMEYAGLSYTAPSEVHYRFMLEGLDKTWTEAGNRRTATYTNLPGRSYRFRVQAMNNDGVWNETGASLSFRVIPPIYRRWWFAAILLLLIVAASAGLYKLRLRRLQVQFDAVLQERNRLAREIHDTLAQDFVGVSIQLDIVSQLLGMQKVDAALDQVRQTRRIVTDGLAEARQSIWALRANVAHGSLPTQLAEVVKRYASDALAVRLNIGGAFRTLDSRIESEVLRVAQEALSNVQRHAGASEAAVELRYGGDMLMLTVDDNGTGFDVEERSGAEGHYGISGMKERAAVLGGSLEITSRLEGGTRVTLSTPIPGTKE